MPCVDGRKGEPQLLRVPYHSKATNESREFLVYLPVGYQTEPSRLWPVILYLHGGGERGDGRGELDYVLGHGPLREAWICHRDLPFVMIAPQLPVFDQEVQVQGRVGAAWPVRPATAPRPATAADRPTQPMMRAPNTKPHPIFNVTEAWGDDGFPGGWQLCDEDLLAMLDMVLHEYRVDQDQVYLTGSSYGGHGTWHIAMTHPHLWAAIAPMCGDGNSAMAGELAKRQLPIWMFHGGRDTLNKPQWAYDMANALEAAGHQSVRFTVHEDCGHNCWTRAYGGQDLYDWFLRHKRS